MKNLVDFNIKTDISVTRLVLMSTKIMQQRRIGTIDFLYLLNQFAQRRGLSLKKKEIERLLERNSLYGYSNYGLITHCVIAAYCATYFEHYRE